LSEVFIKVLSMS